MKNRKSKINNMIASDTDLMFTLLAFLPEKMQRVRDLEELIEEYESEQNEAQKKYDSRIFHVHGRRDKDRLDRVIDRCTYHITQAEITKLCILEEVGDLSHTHPKTADDLRDMLYEIEILIADRLIVSNLWMVLTDHNKKMKNSGGGDAFGRERGSECSAKEEKRVDLREQMKEAEGEWRKQHKKIRKRDNDDKDWDR